MCLFRGNLALMKKKKGVEEILEIFRIDLKIWKTFIVKNY